MTKERFLRQVGNWNNHLMLLWPSLEATKEFKLPVLELGCGMGSTEFLREYCQDEGLEFFSYDSSEEYAKEFNSVHVSDWSTIPWRKDWGVVLVDEAPGEHRKVSLSLLHHAKIVVAHDTEIVGAGDYQMRPQIEKYKYHIDWETPGAWATTMSNFIDVTKFEP